jgi:hypothetical protein
METQNETNETTMGTQQRWDVIAWLRTPAATLAVLCMALIAQLPHAADVFRLIVAGEGWLAMLHGYAYAIALELAVLLFVVQRRDLESYLFACVSVCVNLSYYALHGIDLFSVAALPAWLVSVALPAAIARYSHLLVDEPAPVGAVDAAQPDNEPDAADEAPGAVQVAPVEPVRKAAKPAKKRKAAKVAPLTAAQRRAQIAESGIQDASTVVAQFGVSLRTAQEDMRAVRSGLLSTNGAAH